MAQLLGEILIDSGYLTADGLARALRAQQSHYRRLGEILLHLGLISDKQRAEALAVQLGLEVAGVDDFPTQPVINGEVSPGFLKRSKILPIQADDQAIVLAMADPLDGFARSAVKQATGRDVQIRVAPESDIDTALERMYAQTNATGSGSVLTDVDQTADDIRHLEQRAQEVPVVRLVDRTIERAVEMGASDIHFEAYERSLVVRCRIDGVIQDMDRTGPGYASAVVSRLKILADLDIAERRRPQDGRLRLTRRGTEIDMRISTLPGLHGESAALRLLERTPVAASFSGLGMSESVASSVQHLLERGQGIVLVTGPTGSGKTTTLYAILQQLKDRGAKIISVEDPVEYEVEGITQVPVNAEIGVGFAEVLRSVVRHDPDIIMVGEMRDRETAEIAVQSALTGHLVLSTLHTNDAPSTVVRLMDMGVEPYLIASTLGGVLAQRLVRQLCLECREPVVSGRPADDDISMEYEAVGCSACRGTGYRGRTGIYEFLPVNEQLRSLIVARSASDALHQAAVADGMVTLREDGMRQVAAGATSLLEIQRVVRER